MNSVSGVKRFQKKRKTLQNKTNNQNNFFNWIPKHKLYCSCSFKKKFQTFSTFVFNFNILSKTISTNFLVLQKKKILKLICNLKVERKMKKLFFLYFLFVLFSLSKCFITYSTSLTQRFYVIIFKKVYFYKN